MSRGRDDYDDPGRRRRDDDDDDRDYGGRSGRRNELTGLDKMYATTSVPILILFSLCCNGLVLLPLILSIIAVNTCKDETARGNAKLSLIISGTVVTLLVIVQIVALSMGGGLGGGLPPG